MYQRRWPIWERTKLGLKKKQHFGFLSKKTIEPILGELLILIACDMKNLTIYAGIDFMLKE